jgi:hypothetical protein
MRENQYYLKDQMVEDPVAKVKFPKLAAGATLEVKAKSRASRDAGIFDRLH